MSAILIDSLDCAGGEGKGDGFLEFRYIDAFLLQVWVPASLSGRVELGSTSPVGVSSTHL